MLLNREISLSVRRCFDCGRFWAAETIAVNPKCPHCSAEAIMKANDRAAAAERSVRSLKGALTRAKKRRSYGR